MKCILFGIVFLFLQNLVAEPISVALHLSDTFSLEQLHDHKNFFSQYKVQKRIDLREICARELERNFQNLHQKIVSDLKNVNQILQKKDKDVIQKFPHKSELVSRHKTFVSIVEEAESIFQKSSDFKIKELVQETVKIAVYGCELNKLEKVDIAGGIAYFCKATLVVVKAISRGVSTGVKSAIHTIINPLESVSAFLKVAVQCGNLIGATLLDDDCDTSMYLSLRERTLIQKVKEKELDCFFSFCSNLKSQITKMSGPELIETTTALMVESSIFSAMPFIVKSMKKMVRAVSAHAKALQKKGLLSRPAACIVTTDGELIFFRNRQAYDSLVSDQIFKNCHDLTTNFYIQNLKKSLYVSDEYTSILDWKVLRHIFYGECDSGKVSGFHYENMPETWGAVIPETIKINKLGVSKCKVTINNIEKGPYSTLFPKIMNPQQVVDAILNAYNNKKLQYGNLYYGDSGFGFPIGMYLDKNQKIVSAFPIYRPDI